MAVYTGFASVVDTTSLPTSGGVNVWSNPATLVGPPDGAVATQNPTGYASNFIIQATGFGLAVSGNVVGIEVIIRKQQQSNGTGAVRDDRLQLMKAGSPVGTNVSIAADWPSGGLTDVTYGGPTSLFGQTWTAAQVNASNFGFYIRLYNNGGSGKTAEIDSIQINVYDDVAAPPVASRMTLLGCGV